MLANKEDDSKVKEWMRKNNEKVEKVQAKYDELTEVSTEELIKMAPEDVVTKVRDKLITGIIAEGK